MKSRFIILLLVLSGTVVAQDNNRLFSPEELRADVDYYYEMLYTKHPNPYHYYSLNEFEDVKNRVYAQLSRPLTKAQFNRIIAELNSCLDMHSDIHAYSYLQQTEIIDSIDKFFRLFPPVKINDGKIFLTHGHTRDEIVEINGMTVSDILSDMKKTYNWKLPHAVNYYLIEMLFGAALHVTYKLSAPFRVKFADSDKIYTIKGMTGDEVKKTIKFSPQRTGEHDAYSYKIYPDNSIAIFYITTFNGSKKEQFEKTCNEFIQAVNEQKIKNIFYDLSKNTGGVHLGASALDVICHDTVYFEHTMIRREKATVVRKSKMKELLLFPNHDINIPKSRKLFVLQGVSTMSGGDYFCRLVAENRLGVLVGQPTGEPTTAITSTGYYTMPKTQIGFRIAEVLRDLSDYFDSETLNPDMYWDVNHSRDFTEKELMEIINQWEKQ